MSLDLLALKEERRKKKGKKEGKREGGNSDKIFPYNVYIVKTDCLLE